MSDPVSTESTPPVTPTLPSMTAEQAATVLNEAARNSVLAAKREIAATLARHRCELLAHVEADVGADGITRHRAVVHVVPA